jgi:hypothetical protein
MDLIFPSRRGARGKATGRRTEAGGPVSCWAVRAERLCDAMVVLARSAGRIFWGTCGLVVTAPAWQSGVVLWAAVGSSRRLGAPLPGRGTYKTEGSRKLVSALVGQKP